MGVHKPQVPERKGRENVISPGHTKSEGKNVATPKLSGGCELSYLAVGGRRSFTTFLEEKALIK